ncbi:hypothetical protein P8452_48779 [Trifolium repens]|nr:hypothetical protein P8452_48779 [Trifolium repens]
MNDVMPSISNTRSLNHINNYQINNKNSWSTNEDSTVNDTIRVCVFSPKPKPQNQKLARVHNRSPIFSSLSVIGMGF